MAETQNNWQRVAEATGGVLTPANAIDALAFVAAIKQAPRLDTKEGVVALAVSYTADLVDGAVARATGTSSEVGAAVDAAGDKLKTAFTAFHIGRLGVASRPLLTAVAVHNAANAGATIYDRVKNDESKLELSKAGKYSAFSNSLGIGLQVIGSSLARGGHEKSARFVRRAGAATVLSGLAVYGVPATIQYWREARGQV